LADFSMPVTQTMANGLSGKQEVDIKGIGKQEV
jgi:hypothetical protein